MLDEKLLAVVRGPGREGFNIGPEDCIQTASPVQPPRRVRKLVGQDRPQSGRPLGGGRAAALVPALMRLQQSMLDQIGGLEQDLRLRIELKPGQKPQILAECLQSRTSVIEGLSHRRRRLEG